MSMLPSSSAPTSVRKDRSWAAYAAVVLLLHAAGLAGLLMAASHHPAFWGLGILAYTLGLRHAFDADHIAAIDNTVRKLVELRRSPLGVGFYFSLGHSSVVFLLVLAVALSFQWAQERLPAMQEIGGRIGITVSGTFLLVIGLANLAVLIQLFKLSRIYREAEHREELSRLLESRGWIARLVKPLTALVSKSWHVYPLGFLFGLGFDTATEIGLLAISATAAAGELPVLGILSLPILFAAGMSMLDTADGIFMTRAYRWAVQSPVRHLRYNLTVTFLSVASALFIGGVEIVQMLDGYLHWRSPFMKAVAGLEFSELGYMLAALFALSWGISWLAWRIADAKAKASRV
ncbi:MULTISPECIES: HoxN/HupN/NixA family nickel/cobalt transporter [unclassified Paenibacillus]|uniref:HoxN/HupN/NixA family nickel/cobalt transporter n=2 Tax=Paenibacillus TaxID=44249 RepID=UPI0009558F7B|nr:MULTISPECIES: HoxN/HupN/NixA family nickel/cobalt transporter [unclassified Paenibacillus]SIQ31469.1 high-affinity nickel-transport protein [Paenibacillus sp. RU4X]SIQ53153.1 high-affinity nickel-transport protein [Paenibacillus sp. RU4T]